MNTLCVIILTKNEENNIVSAVANAKTCADEVLVVDAGSTETVELAQNSGAKVVFHQWDGDISAQRNFALRNTDAAWVFYLDADERISGKTGKAIKEIVFANKQVQGKVKRINIAFGHTFSHGAFGPDEVVRLFPKNEVKWINKVHERPICNSPMITIAGALDHYTYDRWQQWWEKAGKYTTIWSEDSYAKGKRTTLVGAVLHTISGMFKALIIQRGFLEGYMGLVSTWQHGLYTLSKYMKLLELQRKCNGK